MPDADPIAGELTSILSLLATNEAQKVRIEQLERTLRNVLRVMKHDAEHNSTRGRQQQVLVDLAEKIIEPEGDNRGGGSSKRPATSTPEEQT